MIDATLSHYKITAELGRGGMGIVYRATDTKLNREVAIKVLPSGALAGDDDRARFFREAQAAAQLHHAHIATIFEIDEAVPSDAPPGTAESPFIAMEYIEGETLEARIRKGPLKLDEAVRIASEIASALESAHAKDIVHRDIKSANVMLTEKGEAKVLDFGLAKTAQSTRLTRMGSTLGTAAYMSPEQARGEEVDGRSDLWSLGIVLYEMMAGVNPFHGDYEQAVVYSILNVDPEPLTAVRTGVPMELEAIVAKCLRKECGHRYQSAADLIADLAAVEKRDRSKTSGLSTVRPATGRRARPSQRRWIYPLVLLAGLIIGGLLVGAMGWRSLRASGPSDVVRSSILLPEAYPLLPGRNQGIEYPELALSKDGQYLVYATPFEHEVALALRDMTDGSIRILKEAQNALMPRFSPDGRSIAYVAGNEVYRIPIDGGRPDFITRVSDPEGLAWLPDGKIYTADLQGGSAISVSTDGQREELMPERRCNCGLPTSAPGHDGVIFSGRGKSRVQWLRNDQKPVDVAVPGNDLTYLSSGYVLYTRTGALYASRYDPSTLDATGDEKLVVDNLRTGSILTSGHYAVSEAGTLVYAAGKPAGLTRVIVRSEDGTETEVGLPEGVYGPVSVSPDERRIVILSYDRGGQWILYDLQHGSNRVIPVEGRANVLWSADGQWIAYTRDEEKRSRVYLSDTDGGNESLLFEVDESIDLSAWSPDGRYLAFVTRLRTSNALFVHDRKEHTESVVRETKGESFWAADWSRDGKFISYTRVGEGGSKVFVEPFPPDGTRRLISPSGGEEPEWLPDRDALVYRNWGSWYIVELNGTSLDALSEPRLYFSGPYVNIAGMEYRMLRNGRAILQRAVNTADTVPTLEVITGLDTFLDHLFDE